MKEYIVNVLNEILSLTWNIESDKLWDYMTEWCKQKFEIYISKDILEKIHMNGILQSLNEKLGITMNWIHDLNFHKLWPFEVENIISVVPVAKDYS